MRKTFLVCALLILGAVTEAQFNTGVQINPAPPQGTSGTVTNIATTSPVTGGPITGTGTIACATCTTSAASLTSNAFVTGAGGQAEQTVALTGIVLGNGASAPTTAASSNVTALWTGTCNSGTFLRGDGACAAAGSGTVTSIATTSPITGGTITTTGTIACATCGVTGSPLSQFASTTSAQLLGVISNPTGTGSLVFGTNPTLGAPTITDFSNATHNHSSNSQGGVLQPLGMSTFTSPSTAGWTFVNQGSSTLTANTGYMTLLGAALGSSNSMLAIIKAAPATPYHIIAAIVPVTCCKNLNAYGLCFSDGTQFNPIWWRNFGNGDNRLAIDYWSNSTTFVANRVSFSNVEVPMYWWRIGDDGTNKTWDISPDGNNWMNANTSARTTDFTPTQIGFCVEPQNTSTPNWPVPVNILSYQVTS